jgi:membrane protease YdiL (CAAX protease family)
MFGVSHAYQGFMAIPPIFCIGLALHICTRFFKSVSPVLVAHIVWDFAIILTWYRH